MSRGELVISDYLTDKFIGNSTGGDSRFRNERGEYHSSSIGKCPRRWKWEFERGTPDEASPYFELGPIYEDIYGEALRSKYGDERVVQDVECTIHFEDFEIVGESDWVVIEEAPDYIPKHVSHWPNEDRSRRVEGQRGHIFDEDPNIDHVIETKTIKDADWVGRYGVKTKYAIQCRTYMWAFGVPGQVAYMERNDLSERVVPLSREKLQEQDIFLRALRQHRNLGDDRLPRANPEDPHDCEYCHFESECRAEGGQRWE